MDSEHIAFIFATIALALAIVGASINWSEAEAAKAASAAGLQQCPTKWARQLAWQRECKEEK